MEMNQNRNSRSDKIQMKRKREEWMHRVKVKSNWTVAELDTEVEMWMTKKREREEKEKGIIIRRGEEKAKQEEEEEEKKSKPIVPPSTNPQLGHSNSVVFLSSASSSSSSSSSHPLPHSTSQYRRDSQSLLHVHTGSNVHTRKRCYWLYHGQMLRSSQTLQHYGIQRGAIVYLIYSAQQTRPRNRMIYVNTLQTSFMDSLAASTPPPPPSSPAFLSPDPLLSSSSSPFTSSSSSSSSSSSPSSLCIFVRHLSSHTFVRVNLCPFTTRISSLRALISQHTPTPAIDWIDGSTLLLYGGLILEDNKKMNEYNIEPGSVISYWVGNEREREKLIKMMTNGKNEGGDKKEEEIGGDKKKRGGSREEKEQAYLAVPGSSASASSSSSSAAAASASSSSPPPSSSSSSLLDFSYDLSAFLLQLREDLDTVLFHPSHFSHLTRFFTFCCSPPSLTYLDGSQCRIALTTFLMMLEKRLPNPWKKNVGRGNQLIESVLPLNRPVDFQGFQLLLADTLVEAVRTWTIEELVKMKETEEANEMLSKPTNSVGGGGSPMVGGQKATTNQRMAALDAVTIQIHPSIDSSSSLLLSSSFGLLQFSLIPSLVLLRHRLISQFCVALQKTIIEDLWNGKEREDKKKQPKLMEDERKKRKRGGKNNSGKTGGGGISRCWGCCSSPGTRVHNSSNRTNNNSSNKNNSADHSNCFQEYEEIEFLRPLSLFHYTLVQIFRYLLAPFYLLHHPDTKEVFFSSSSVSASRVGFLRFLIFFVLCFLTYYLPLFNLILFYAYSQPVPLRSSSFETDYTLGSSFPSLSLGHTYSWIIWENLVLMMILMLGQQGGASAAVSVLPMRWIKIMKIQKEEEEKEEEKEKVGEEGMEMEMAFEEATLRWAEMEATVSHLHHKSSSSSLLSSSASSLSISPNPRKNILSSPSFSSSSFSVSSSSSSSTSKLSYRHPSRLPTTVENNRNSIKRKMSAGSLMMMMMGNEENGNGNGIGNGNGGMNNNSSNVNGGVVGGAVRGGFENVDGWKAEKLTAATAASTNSWSLHSTSLGPLNQGLTRYSLSIPTTSSLTFLFEEFLFCILPAAAHALGPYFYTTYYNFDSNYPLFQDRYDGYLGYSSIILSFLLTYSLLYWLLSWWITVQQMIWRMKRILSLGDEQQPAALYLDLTIEKNMKYWFMLRERAQRWMDRRPYSSSFFTSSSSSSSSFFSPSSSLHPLSTYFLLLLIFTLALFSRTVILRYSSGVSLFFILSVFDIGILSLGLFIGLRIGKKWNDENQERVKEVIEGQRLRVIELSERHRYELEQWNFQTARQWFVEAEKHQLDPQSHSSSHSHNHHFRSQVNPGVSSLVHSMLGTTGSFGSNGHWKGMKIDPLLNSTHLVQEIDMEVDREQLTAVHPNEPNQDGVESVSVSKL